MRYLRTLAPALVIALLAGCGSAGEGTGPARRTLTIASAIDLNSFDPADGIDGHFPQYLQPVYDSLVRIDPKGRPQPMLATRWRYTDPRRTRLRLTLRSGVAFSDGEAFDAAAVKANLLNVKNGKGTLATALSLVKEIEVVSPTVVELGLVAPDPTLLRNLGQPPGMMASPRALGKKSLKTTPVGSGPYLLDPKHTTKGRQYTYIRNRTYWDPDLVSYDRIVIKPILDTTARLNALRSGQADVGMGEPRIASQAKAAGLTVTSWSTGDLAALYIFDRDGALVPALEDLRVRRALNYAIDADALVEKVLKGYGRVTRQVFNLDTNGYDASLERRYRYDPAKAKSLLAEAGYPDGFELPMPQLPVTAELGAVVAQQLKDVSITVKWRNVAMTSVISDVSSGKFPALLFFFQSGDPWQAINYYVGPRAPWNPLHTDDPRVNQLIAEAQNSTGETQAATYRKLNAYLVDQAWFAPWASPSVVYLSTRSVGVTAQAFAPIPSVYNYSPAGS